MRLILLSIIAIALMSVPSRADNESPKVLWFFQEFPPFYITSGDRKGKGVADKTLQYFIDRLPQFSHSLVQANYSRAFTAIKERDGACHAGLFKTPEREKHMVFSDYVQLVIPNRMITLRKNRDRYIPYLNEAGEIELSKLMQAEDFVTGVVNSRVYSEKINDALNTNKASETRVEVPYHLSATLLLRERIDYTFGYLIEAAYLFEEQGQRDAYVTLPIAGEQQILFARFACSKTELGQKIVDAIDVIIAQQDTTPAYRHYYMEWLNDAALTDYLNFARSIENVR